MNRRQSTVLPIAVMLLLISGGVFVGFAGLVQTAARAGYSTTDAVAPPNVAGLVQKVTATAPVETWSVKPHVQAVQGPDIRSIERSVSPTSLLTREGLADVNSVGVVAETVVLANGTVIPGNFLPTNGAGPNDAVYDGDNGLVYVPDFLSNNVSVLDGATQAVVATIPVGVGPNSISFDASNGMLYVENIGLSNNITVINGATDEVVGSFVAGSAPGAGAFDPDNGYLYFGDAGTGSVAVVDPSTRAVVASVPAGGCAGDGEQSVIFDPLNENIYVANECSSNVTVISGASNSVIASVDVGEEPFALALDPATGLIYVANAGGTNVTIIDGATPEAIGSIEVGLTPVGLVISGSTGYLYVENQGSNNVTVIDVASEHSIGSVSVGEVPQGGVYDPTTGGVEVPNYYSYNVTLISSDDRTLASVSLGDDPLSAAYDPGNGNVYIANVGWNNVTILNGSTGDVLGSVGAGSGPDSVAYDSRNGELFVANAISDNLTIVNGTTGTAVGSVPVGAFPRNVVYDSTDNALFVGNDGSNNVTVVNATTGRIVTSIAQLGAPGSLAWDSENGDVYVTSNDSNVSVIGPSSYEVTATIPVGSLPFALAYDPESGDVFVADIQVGNVTIISTELNQVVTSVPAGVGPDALVYDGDNGFVYVADLFSNNLTALNGSTGQPVGSIDVGNGPTAVAFDTDPHIFATDGYSGSVTVISPGPPNTFAIAFTTSPTSCGSIEFDATAYTNGQSVSVAAGTYAVSATACSGYSLQTVAGTGSVIVSGGEAIVSGAGGVTAVFTPVTSSVTFTQSNLPSGTWYLNITGPLDATLSGTGTSLSTALPYGNYSYTVGATFVGKKAYSAPSGSFQVPRTTMPVQVVFARAYPVTFTEKGIPASHWAVSEWWVNITGGVSASSTTTKLKIWEVAGAHSYTVGSLNKEYAASGSSFTMTAKAAPVAVRFHLVTTTVTFDEMGLTATKWCVKVTSPPVKVRQYCTKQASLSFPAPNGTYTYTLTTSKKGWSAPGGSFTVPTSTMPVQVTFSTSGRGSTPAAVALRGATPARAVLTLMAGKTWLRSRQ